MYDERYSTTRCLITEKPIHFDETIDGHSATFLKTPESAQKIAEGGLRLKGYFKSSCGEESPLITVITVVYNGSEHLEESIKHVIEQRYHNVEYIIVDGGSKDSTLQIIKKYEHAIDYWVSEPDGGIYDAMNKGINLATKSSWIIFIGADDLLIDVSSAASFVRSSPGANCIVANVEGCHSNTGRVYPYKCWLPDKMRLEKDFLHFPLHHQGFLFKKEREVFYFNSQAGIHADLDQMIKTIRNGKAAYIDSIVSQYTTGGASDNFSMRNLVSFFAVAKMNNLSFSTIILSSPLLFLRLLVKAVIGRRAILFLRDRGMTGVR